MYRQKTLTVLAFCVTNLVGIFIFLELSTGITALLRAGFAEGAGEMQMLRVLVGIFLLLIIPIAWFAGVVTSGVLYWRSVSLKKLKRLFLLATGIEFLCVPLIPLVHTFAAALTLQTMEWVMILVGVVGGCVFLYFGANA